MVLDSEGEVFVLLNMTVKIVPPVPARSLCNAAQTVLSSVRNPPTTAALAV